MDAALNWERVRIPESCRGVDIVVGVDEAGRGPVLGPLVYGAAFWPVSEDAAIQKMGFNDSKQLKESDRERFFAEIRNHPSIGWVIEEISAADISRDMMRVAPVSLNTISYNAVCRMLSRIVSDDPNPPQITDVYVDTVGDPAFYKSRLVANLGEDFATFTIEKKADAIYKVVGAASIVAKVHRDTVIKNWQWAEPTVTLERNFGSGYPGDENCVKWLVGAQQRVFGYPSLVRFSWSTTREALERGAACKVSWECEEEDSAVGSANITDFFHGPGASASKKAKRTAYFSNKKMKHIGWKDLTQVA
ncbi:ribonuclease H-like domain-containing protein [Ochromonadaceae sp. CCMP2298]|nr:ribonuclease H-like domain-containing protein [Ochromonadaceae sp. CCMP2298]